ncbi:MAG: hypothetical protein H8E66_00860 [Planctomycetes bacterium]|nr:hypothetical protein [Planctomycetota bacterium]
MRRLLALTVAIVLVGGMITFVRSSLVSAQAKGKTRPLTTSQMMAGLVKPKYVELKDGLAKETLGDDDWKALATHAALLNESSHMLMADDRCPDKTWEDASMILRNASDDALAALSKKNADGAAKAFENISLSCKTCHAEFKYKK